MNLTTPQCNNLVSFQTVTTRSADLHLKASIQTRRSEKPLESCALFYENKIKTVCREALAINYCTRKEQTYMKKILSFYPFNTSAATES